MCDTLKNWSQNLHLLGQRGVTGLYCHGQYKKLNPLSRYVLHISSIQFNFFFFIYINLFGLNLTYLALMWPWKFGQGHQNLIKSSSCRSIINCISMQICFQSCAQDSITLLSTDPLRKQNGSHTPLPWGHKIISPSTERSFEHYSNTLRKIKFEGKQVFFYAAWTSVWRVVLNLLGYLSLELTWST